MKKAKIHLITMALVGVISQTVSAAEIPIEAAPCNATKESIAVTENIIGNVLEEVKNGLGYGEAYGIAQTAICKAVIDNQTEGFGYADLMSIARNSIFLYRDMYLRPELYKSKRETVYCLISDLIEAVGAGKDYNEALNEAYARIYQSADSAYSQNTEIAYDRIYEDTPPVDFVMFTQARKLLLEAIPKTE